MLSINIKLFKYQSVITCIYHILQAPTLFTVSIVAAVAINPRYRCIIYSKWMFHILFTMHEVYSIDLSHVDSMNAIEISSVGKERARPSDRIC